MQHLDPKSGKFSLFRHEPNDLASLAHNSVNTLARDIEGRLWVGTSGGVDRLASDGKTFLHHGSQAAGRANAKPAAVLSLMFDRQNALWVGTAAGLEIWTVTAGGVQRRQFGPDEDFTPGQVNVVYQDRDGNIWIGTESDGLKRWDAAAGRFVAYRNQANDSYSLASNRVVSLQQDRTGTPVPGSAVPAAPIWPAAVSNATSSASKSID